MPLFVLSMLYFGIIDAELLNSSNLVWATSERVRRRQVVTIDPAAGPFRQPIQLGLANNNAFADGAMRHSEAIMTAATLCQVSPLF